MFLRSILHLSLPPSLPQETDLCESGFHALWLLVEFIQWEALAGDEKEEKEFREHNAHPPRHNLGSSCIALSMPSAPVRGSSPMLHSYVECCPEGNFPSPCPFWPLEEMASRCCQSLGAFSSSLVPLTLFIPQERVSSLNSPQLTL